MADKLNRRAFLRAGALAAAGISLNGILAGRAVAHQLAHPMAAPRAALAVNHNLAATGPASARFYRLNDQQEFFRAYNDNEFGIGFGKPWGLAKLGDPAMVAANLGGFPFQPVFIPDPILGQVLYCSVHKLTPAELQLLNDKGQPIRTTARRLGVIGQSFASSAFHVNPPDRFSHIEFLVRLPMGIHTERVNGAEITTGIDNTFVGVWLLPDLDRLSTDLAGLQATGAITADDLQQLRDRFNDLMIEIDLLEAVGHSSASLSFIMSGLHRQGPGSGTAAALYYDGQFFYNTSGPRWLKFMADHHAPFDWAKDYLKITFDFAADGHWRTYFNDIGIVDSYEVLQNSKVPRAELLRRIPVRIVSTPAGPVPLHYFIIFHAAAGGNWPGLPTAPNDTAVDGMRVAYLYIS